MGKTKKKINNNSGRIPDELISAMNEGSLVAFCGAGISKDLGLPTWEDFSEKVLEELNYKKNEVQKKISRDYLENKNAGKKKRKKDALKDLSQLKRAQRPKVRLNIYNEFRLPVGKLCKIQELILQITNKVITTNYDNAFETAYENNNGGSRPILILPFDDTLQLIADEMRTKDKIKQNYIFKLHGSSSIPDSCVIFEEDYTKLYSTESEKDIAAAPRLFLSTIARDYTILFIGFSFNDQRVKKFIKAICQGDKFDGKHYIIEKDDNASKYINKEEFSFLNCITVSDWKNDFVNLLNELIQNKKLTNREKLRQVYIFKGLSDDSINKIEAIPPQTINNGDTLSKPGNEASSFWVILDGELRIDKEIKRGAKEMIGEIGFTLQDKRERTITCNSDNTTIIEINKNFINTLIERDQDILWQNIAFELHRKYFELHPLDNYRKKTSSWEMIAKSLSESIRNDIKE